MLKMLQKDRRIDPGAKYSPVFGRYSFLDKESEGALVAVGDEVQITKRNTERTVFGELLLLPQVYVASCYYNGGCAQLKRFRKCVLIRAHRLARIVDKLSNYWVFLRDVVLLPPSIFRPVVFVYIACMAMQFSNPCPIPLY